MRRSFICPTPKNGGSVGMTYALAPDFSTGGAIQQCHGHLLNLACCCKGSKEWLLQVTGREVDLPIPAGAPDGLLWLEAETDGILSEAVPLVLTRDADVAAEVAGLADAGRPPRLLHALVIDIGLALQCAGRLHTPVTTPPATGKPLKASSSVF